MNLFGIPLKKNNLQPINLLKIHIMEKSKFKPMSFLRKQNRFFLIFLSLIFSGYCMAQESDLSKLFLKLRPSIFLIETFNDLNEPIAKGTGFFIESNGICLSNYHVFVNAKKAIIKTHDNKTFNIDNILSYDSKKDIIKFSIENLENLRFQSILLDTTDQKVGSKVFTIGNPLGLEYTLTDGIISAFRNYTDYGRLIQISVPVSSGNSGSPLLNLNGKAIGIVSMGINEGQNLNFAVSIKETNNLTTLNKLVFPSVNSKTTKNPFEKIPIGTAMAMVKEYEKNSEFDGFSTSSWNSMYSSTDNYTKALVYNNIILDTILCNVKYLFQHSYLLNIEYSKSIILSTRGRTQTIGFASTIKEFNHFMNLLTESYGRPEILFSNEYPWISKMVDYFYNYSDFLETAIKIHPNDLIIFVWYIPKTNTEILLDISYSGPSKQNIITGEKNESEKGSWSLTIRNREK